MDNDHGAYVKCPRCGWKRVTYADRIVRCNNPNGCRYGYSRHENETHEPIGNGTGDPGFRTAAEIKAARG